MKKEPSNLFWWRGGMKLNIVAREFYQRWDDGDGTFNAPGL